MVASQVLDAIRRLQDAEILGAVATVIAGPDIGAKAVAELGRGFVAGALPDELRDDVLADIETLAAHEQNRTLDYGPRRVFIETVAPAPVLLVFGAGHVAQPLTRIARELGFRTVVADARGAFATQERFPDVDELVVGWPERVLDHVDLDRRTYVVVLSHDPRFETPVFPAVRRAPVRYIGAMGSRRTHQSRIERLRSEGWSDEELARIHAPIGLDLGAETAAETAISILAEIIQVRYGQGTGVSLRGTEGTIHPQRSAHDAAD